MRELHIDMEYGTGARSYILKRCQEPHFNYRIRYSLQIWRAYRYGGASYSKVVRFTEPCASPLKSVSPFLSDIYTHMAVDITTTIRILATLIARLVNAHNASRLANAHNAARIRGLSVASSDQNEGFRMDLIWSSNLILRRPFGWIPVQLNFSHKFLMFLWPPKKHAKSY